MKTNSSGKKKNDKKLKVALIFGGTSVERGVSLNSAKAVAQYLDTNKYDVISVEISKQGKWLLESETIKKIGQKTKTTKLQTREIVPFEKGSKGKVDVALLAMHGPGGEDGTLQGMLELLGVAYTGSGVLASSLAMDKAKAKKFLATEGMPVLPHILINKADFKDIDQKTLKKFKRVLVIKPNRLGSSIGITIAEDPKEIKNGIRKALKETDEVMLEPFLPGREITVPVLGNKKPEALPAVEIVPWKKSSFYDYDAKYADGGSEHIIPAPITKEQEETVKELALLAHTSLDCRGVTRSDFILDEKGQFFFLEINTIPGMTPTSLVPQSAQVAGIDYSQLLDKLIKLAREVS